MKLFRLLQVFLTSQARFPCSCSLEVGEVVPKIQPHSYNHTPNTLAPTVIS